MPENNSACMQLSGINKYSKDTLKKNLKNTYKFHKHLGKYAYLYVVM